MKLESYSAEKTITCIGRRKTSVAIVKIYSAENPTNSFEVNGRTPEDYFQFSNSKIQCLYEPMKSTETSHQPYHLGISAKVYGGGLNSQAEAIRLAISRGLLKYPNTREILKSKGFLTRDPRSKERKKYGLKKARKASQFSKR